MHTLCRNFFSKLKPNSIELSRWRNRAEQSECLISIADHIADAPPFITRSLIKLAPTTRIGKFSASTRKRHEFSLAAAARAPGCDWYWVSRCSLQRRVLSRRHERRTRAVLHYRRLRDSHRSRQNRVRCWVRSVACMVIFVMIAGRTCYEEQSTSAGSDMKRRER